MRYLAEIGHLEAGASIDFGVARVHRLEDGLVQFKGRDNASKPWHVVHGATGGVGWTEVWTSDFDADGHKDFLIGQMFPGNGVCVNPVRLTLLLFDANGRPVPWIGQTQLPDNPSGKELTFPYLPVRVTDTDKDGRAEFVLEDCARDNRQREKKWVSAVHKAKSNRLDDRPASDRIDGLMSGEFGRQAVRGRQTVISGKRVASWPDNIVFDPAHQLLDRPTDPIDCNA